MTVMSDPARIPSVHHDCVKHGFSMISSSNEFNGPDGGFGQGYGACIAMRGSLAVMEDVCE